MKREPKPLDFSGWKAAGRAMLPIPPDQQNHAANAGSKGGPMSTTATQLAEVLRGVLDWGTDENYQRAHEWCEKARQALAAFEAQAAMSPKQTSGTSEPVTDKQLLAEAEFAESYDASAPSFMSLLRDDAVVGDFQRRLLICMRAAVKLAAPVAQAEPWVSVTERLPDHKGGYFDTTPCLLAWDDGTVESGWYCGKGSFQHANGDMDYHEEAKVTHWMPLPQPPKEGT